MFDVPEPATVIGFHHSPCQVVEYCEAIAIRTLRVRVSDPFAVNEDTSKAVYLFRYQQEPVGRRAGGERAKSMTTGGSAIHEPDGGWSMYPVWEDV